MFSIRQIASGPLFFQNNKGLRPLLSQNFITETGAVRLKRGAVVIA